MNFLTMIESSYMILFLDIKDKNNATWLLVEDKNIKDSLDFIIDRDNDKTFLTLEKLLSNNRITLSDLNGLALTIKDASLTQVKIYTAIINTFAWQLGIVVSGKYYYNNDFEKIYLEIIDRLKKEKKKILDVEYKQNPDISKSKKVRKYVIKK